MQAAQGTFPPAPRRASSIHRVASAGEWLVVSAPEYWFARSPATLPMAAAPACRRSFAGQRRGAPCSGKTRSRTARRRERTPSCHPAPPRAAPRPVTRGAVARMQLLEQGKEILDLQQQARAPPSATSRTRVSALAEPPTKPTLAQVLKLQRDLAAARGASDALREDLNSRDQVRGATPAPAGGVANRWGER